MRTMKKNAPQDNRLEIIDAVKALASEKGISADMLFTSIEDALKIAYRRHVDRDGNSGSVPSNISVTLNRNTGETKVLVRKTVVEEIDDPVNQITLDEALQIRPDYRIGDLAEIDVTPNGFLRTAAQAAKQKLMQSIRDAERGKVYDMYSEKENEILTAIVLRIEDRGAVLDLGSAIGILENSQFIPGEELKPGDHIKVYVLDVDRKSVDARRAAYPQVLVSRVHDGLVKRLFEMEVPEIAAGLVVIKSIAREAGSRTKIAVHSNDPSIDPVGACVGPRGNRVERVVSELHDEKVDIIKWTADPAEFIANSLNPAHVLSVFVADSEKACRVIVPDNQLSLAIGKEGQNARLAAHLTGWRIDIKSQSQAAEMFSDIPLEAYTVEEAAGYQAYNTESATDEELKESSMPELRDFTLAADEDDTL